jgi:hypothetical protein
MTQTVELENISIEKAGEGICNTEHPKYIGNK